MSVVAMGVLWTYLRMFCRFFVEGVFCCSLFTTRSSQSHIVRKFSLRDQRQKVLFGFLYSFSAMLPYAFFHIEFIDRLVAVGVAFFYFWYRERVIRGVTRGRYGSLGWRCILTTAVFSVLIVEFSLTVCHTLLHASCASSGIYDTIRGNWVLYELYKSMLMVLHLCVLVLIYKSRFLEMSNIKDMASHKWVVSSFSFCLLLIVYIGYNYAVFREMPSFAPYCDVLLWILALMMPMYVGFYMAVSELTRLLSVKANCAVDDNIFVWIFNPSMIETIHLNIYDSELFMPSFEASRLAFKKRLEKLGIDNGYKGYSELVFCLVLTKLFMGMKGWSFERDIFGQASVVIDMPFPEVKKNIEDVIARTWLIDDAEMLIDGYYLPCCGTDMYDQQQRPSVEEFLMSMAKSV